MSTEATWIKCDRDHGVRVLPMGLEALLQVHVEGVLTTTTILGPTARRALIEALGGEARRQAITEVVEALREADAHDESWSGRMS